MTAGAAGDDEVTQRRARIGRLAARGKRIGYLLFLGAMALFVVGFFTTFNGITAQVIVAALVVGSIILAPSLVMSYGVGAAEREDRQLKDR